jgi:glycosyltransferase involved in cell wall biosynthesis
MPIVNQLQIDVSQPKRGYVKLDVVVPTYNRSSLLRAAISSLLRSPVPAGLDVTIWIVDNNSKDDTEMVVRQMQSEAAIPCHYIKEMNQGSSRARNAGIRAGNGEIIGFIDDDEQIDEKWYEVVAREFADERTEFIAGAYHPDWTAPAPEWLPSVAYSAIGVTAPLTRSSFDGPSPRELWGGNAVIRRSVFESVGLFSTQCGRGATGLLMNEDKEFQERMVSAGHRGIYLPDLIIYHHIPAARLTRNYSRRWHFWNGSSEGLFGRKCKEPVRYLLGIPRYIVGRALKGLASLPHLVLVARNPKQAFASELRLWFLLGYIHGMYFLSVEDYFKQR